MTTARALLRRLWRTDAPLTALGIAMGGALALFGIALLVDTRTIAGAPAWMKPAKFAASIAIFALTLTWIFSYLSDWPRLRRIVSLVTVITLGVEIVLISTQAWRGALSHFNVAAPLDAAIFSIMGFAIVVQTVASIAVAIALWRQPFTDRALGSALRLGLTLSIVGASTGGLMVRPTPAQMEDLRAGGRPTIVGGHTVGAPDGGPGMPATGWSIAHGDLRVAHFMGLHAVQALPLFALIIARRGGLQYPETVRVRLVVTAAASYAGMFSLLLWQALRGQSIANPDSATIVAVAAWAALTTVGMLSAIPHSRMVRVSV